jgi:hypothetical protein
LTAAAATLGPAALALRWWEQPPMTGFRFLSEDEVRFFDAFAEAVFPAGGTPPLGGGSAQVGRFADEIWSGMMPFQRNLIRESIHAFDQLARVEAGERLTTLAPTEAERVISGWMEHSRSEVRGVATTFHIFSGMAWTTHPEVAEFFARRFRCGYAR